MRGHHHPDPGVSLLNISGLQTQNNVIWERCSHFVSSSSPNYPLRRAALHSGYSLSTPSVHNYVLTLITQLSFLLPVQLKHDIQSDTDITR